MELKITENTKSPFLTPSTSKHGLSIAMVLFQKNSNNSEVENIWSNANNGQSQEYLCANNFLPNPG